MKNEDLETLNLLSISDVNFHGRNKELDEVALSIILSEHDSRNMLINVSKMWL